MASVYVMDNDDPDPRNAPARVISRDHTAQVRPRPTGIWQPGSPTYAQSQFGNSPYGGYPGFQGGYPGIQGGYPGISAQPPVGFAQAPFGYPGGGALNGRVNWVQTPWGMVPTQSQSQLGNFFGGLNLGSLVDVGAQIIAAFMGLPEAPAPSSEGNASLDVQNAVTYQSALASHAKRDEQIRTIGSVVAKLIQ